MPLIYIATTIINLSFNNNPQEKKNQFKRIKLTKLNELINKQLH